MSILDLQKTKGQALARNSILVLRILTLLGERTGIGLAALSSAMDAPKSSVYRALQDLVEEGWVAITSDFPAKYVLTNKVLSIGRGASLTHVIADAAAPTLDAIHAHTGENVQLSYLEEASIVGFERRESIHPLRVVLPIGKRIPWHATAAGKAIAGHLDEVHLGHLLDADRASLTAHTITEREALLHEIEQGRQIGFTVSRDGYREGVVSIASAILDAARHPIAALSINGVASRLTHTVVSEYGPLVRDGAQQIARTLSH